MGKQLLKCFFAAVAVHMALPNMAFACTCMAGGRIEDRAAYQRWFEQRAVVFRGTVIADELLPPLPIANAMIQQRKVTFNVERQWKGAVGSTIAVITNVGEGMCGIEYQRGGRYFVAADRRTTTADLTAREVPDLQTDGCRGATYWMRDEKRFLETFGNGQPPT